MKRKMSKELQKCYFQHLLNQKVLRYIWGMWDYYVIYSIRTSTKNFGFENDIKCIPLYSVFCLDNL